MEEAIYMAENNITYKDAQEKLNSLNLIDNFMFGNAISHPKYGKKIAGIILKYIFGREFTNLTVQAQKVYYGANTKLHGARLDVYIEETVAEETNENKTDAKETNVTTTQNAIYDIEPEKYKDKSSRLALPKRVRFYHSMIDKKQLESGEDYSKLKRVFVIMITPYDPFGYNHMIYTIKTHCEEVPNMPYEDGSTTLFLYPDGELGVISKELKAMLQFITHTDDTHATNEDLRYIENAVDDIKKNSEVTTSYMRVMIDENILLSRGIEIGKNQGIEIGKNQGIEIGKNQGAQDKLVSLINKKLSKGKTISEIAEDLEETEDVIDKIIKDNNLM